MNRVWVWVTREDGQIEQHIGPFERYVRGPDGRALSEILDGRVVPLVDREYAARVYLLLESYSQHDAYGVAMDLTASAVKEDDTGALAKLVVALAEITARVQLRQERVRRGTQNAVWMADFELAAMTVHVRGE